MISMGIFSLSVFFTRSGVLPQEALAEELDIDPQTLAFIEQRRRYPSLPLLFALCARLGIKVKLI